MTNREQAASHVAQAEELLAEKPRDVHRSAMLAAQASAHATLAVYFQREADREGEK